MRFMRVLAVSLCALLLAVSVAGKEDEYTKDTDFSKLRLKELRRFLEERGVECHGCAEKSHYVDKVRESIDLPKIPKAERRAASKKNKKSKKKGKNKRPPTARDAPAYPEDDLGDGLSSSAIREALKKQLDEKRRMQEALRKAGINQNFDQAGGEVENLERILASLGENPDEL